MAHAWSSLSHAFHLPRNAAWHAFERGLRAILLVAAGFAVGVLVTNLAAPLLGAVADAAPRLLAPGEAAGEIPDLAPEWRWQQDAVSFDHMYRPGGATGPSLRGMVREPR